MSAVPNLFKILQPEFSSLIANGWRLHEKSWCLIFRGKQRVKLLSILVTKIMFLLSQSSVLFVISVTITLVWSGSQLAKILTCLRGLGERKDGNKLFIPQLNVT